MSIWCNNDMLKVRGSGTNYYLRTNRANTPPRTVLLILKYVGAHGELTKWFPHLGWPPWRGDYKGLFSSVK